MLKIHNFTQQIFLLGQLPEFNGDGKFRNQLIQILACSILFTLISCAIVLIYKKIAKKPPEPRKSAVDQILNRSPKAPIHPSISVDKTPHTAEPQIDALDPVKIIETRPLVLPPQKVSEIAQSPPGFIQTQGRSSGADTILNRSPRAPIIPSTSGNHKIDKPAEPVIIDELAPFEISGTLPLVLSPLKDWETAQFHPKFIQTNVSSTEITNPPVNASLSTLVAMFKRVDQFQSFQDYLKKCARSKQVPNPTEMALDVNQRISRTIHKINDLDKYPSSMSEEKKMYTLLLHIADYLEKQSKKIEELNTKIKKLEDADEGLTDRQAAKEEIIKIEKNILSILIDDIGLAFEKCIDRQLSDLENIYFTRIVQNEAFIDSLTFKNKVLLALLIARRMIFDQAVDITLQGISSFLHSHNAASYRYYMRLYREEFGLGGISDDESMYETDTFVAFGYEDAVKKQFEKLYTPEYVFETFREMVRTDKGKNGPFNDCYHYLKETYDLTKVDPNELLDKETFQLTPAICLRVLFDFEILIRG